MASTTFSDVNGPMMVTSGGDALWFLYLGRQYSDGRKPFGPDLCIVQPEHRGTSARPVTLRFERFVGNIQRQRIRARRLGVKCAIRAAVKRIERRFGQGAFAQRRLLAPRHGHKPESRAVLGHEALRCEAGQHGVPDPPTLLLAADKARTGHGYDDKDFGSLEVHPIVVVVVAGEGAPLA